MALITEGGRAHKTCAYDDEREKIFKCTFSPSHRVKRRISPKKT